MLFGYKEDSRFSKMNILLDSNTTIAVGISELFLITNLVSWTVDIIVGDFVDISYFLDCIKMRHATLNISGTEIDSSFNS